MSLVPGLTSARRAAVSKPPPASGTHPVTSHPIDSATECSDWYAGNVTIT